MASLAIVGLCILPILEARELATNKAFRSGHMLTALSYAQRLLAERMRDPERLKERQGVIEEDPVYRFEMTLEDFDLSTGRVEEEDESAQGAASSGFSTESAFTPPNDAVPEDESKENAAYKVRRVTVRVFYPAVDGDREDQIVLEGYVPRVIEPDDGTSLENK